jgi:predicted secreted protein
MVKNTKKNTGGVTGKGFDVSGQPSPELKKKGWERRRMAREMMDIYDKYQHMSYKEFLDIKEDIKNNPQNYTVVEVDMFKYAKNPKFILDRIDRHISKAPTEFKGEVKNITIEDIRNAFNEDIDDTGEGYGQQSPS